MEVWTIAGRGRGGDELISMLHNVVVTVWMREMEEVGLA
jgi:hypothetical protein